MHRRVEPEGLLQWTRANPCASLFLVLQSEPLNKVRFSFDTQPVIEGGGTGSFQDRAQEIPDFG